MNTIQLFQAYSGAELQRQFLDECAAVINFNEAGARDEYQLFKYIKKNYAPSMSWGVLSWKFEIKTGVSLAQFAHFASEEIKNGADVVFINPMIVNEALFIDVWEQGEVVGHNGIQDIKKALIDLRLIQDLPVMTRDLFAMCNYFVGGHKFWEIYLDFVDNCIHKLKHGDHGRRGNDNIFSPSNYKKDPSIPMQTFVIERLFSSFLYSHPHLNISRFRYSEDLYIKKLGIALGRYAYGLSELKYRAVTERSYQHFCKWDVMRKNFLANGLAYHLCLHQDDPEVSFFSDLMSLSEHRKD